MLNFDPQIVKKRFDYDNQKYSVTYYLWKQANDSLKSPKDVASLKHKKGYREENHVCFSMLPSIMRDHPELNRLAYVPQWKLISEKVLSETDRKDFVRLAREHKLLPPHVKTTHFDMTFVFPLNVPSHLVYVWLATLRLVEEQPDVARVFVYCVRDLKMNPFASLIFAVSALGGNAGHMYLGIYGSTALPPNMGLLSVPIHNMIALCRFISNPLAAPRADDWGFCSERTIISLCDIRQNVMAKHLDHPLILQAINSKDDYAARNLLERFDREKDSNAVSAQ